MKLVGEYVVHLLILVSVYIIPCLWFAFPAYTEYVNQNTSVASRQFAYSQLTLASNFYLSLVIGVLSIFQSLLSIQHQLKYSIFLTYLCIGTGIGYIMVFFFEIVPITSWSQLLCLDKLLWALFVTLCILPSMREINFQYDILATEMNNVHSIAFTIILFFNWVGAFVIPLDWERPYQQFPICCLFGNAIGLVCVIIVAVLFERSALIKKKKE